MKATGIVRRIDYRVIIGTKVNALIALAFSLTLSEFSELKAMGNLLL